MIVGLVGDEPGMLIAQSDDAEGGEVKLVAKERETGVGSSSR